MAASDDLIRSVREILTPQNQPTTIANGAINFAPTDGAPAWATQGFSIPLLYGQDMGAFQGLPYGGDFNNVNTWGGSGPQFSDGLEGISTSSLQERQAAQPQQQQFGGILSDEQILSLVNLLNPPSNNTVRNRSDAGDENIFNPSTGPAARYDTYEDFQRGRDASIDRAIAGISSFANGTRDEGRNSADVSTNPGPDTSDDSNFGIFANGGKVSGPGGGRDDAVPAMLSDGEYVIPADVVAMLGGGSTDAGVQMLNGLVDQTRVGAGEEMASRAGKRGGNPLAEVM